jgi:hypothetical protein
MDGCFQLTVPMISASVGKRPVAFARAQQRHLRVWSLLADYARRRTGARFIASLPAVLDFDAHRLPFLVCGDARTTSP